MVRPRGRGRHGRGDRRKSKCCLRLFRPDPRNRRLTLVCKLAPIQSSSRVQPHLGRQADLVISRFNYTEGGSDETFAASCAHPGDWLGDASYCPNEKGYRIQNARLGDAQGLALPARPQGKVPTIVMAHGFSAVKEMYLDKF